MHSFSDVNMRFCNAIPTLSVENKYYKSRMYVKERRTKYRTLLFPNHDTDLLIQCLQPIYISICQKISRDSFNFKKINPLEIGYHEFCNRINETEFQTRQFVDFTFRTDGHSHLCGT
jgi:hypothetical protein